MDEAEYQRLITPLQAQYDGAIAAMNAESSPGFKNMHRAEARAFMQAIHRVQSQYDHDKGVAEIGYVKCSAHVTTWASCKCVRCGEEVDSKPRLRKKLRSHNKSPIEMKPQVEMKPITWLEHHDALIKEYFDGERALIDELWPDKSQPEPAPRRAQQTVAVKMPRSFGWTAAAIFSILLSCWVLWGIVMTILTLTGII